MSLLEWMNVIEKLVGHVAWPLAAFLIIRQFKTEITTLFKRIRKASYKGVEVDLSGEIKSLKTSAEKAGVTIFYPEPSLSKESLDKVIEAPELALMKSWSEIERTLRLYGSEKSFEPTQNIIVQLTCAPTSYHFLVESFDCFGLMRPSVASVDFGHIHAV